MNTLQFTPRATFLDIDDLYEDDDDLARLLLHKRAQRAYEIARKMGLTNMVPE